ncbi:MAG: hypothetical protein AAF937_03275 [Planctomycetota bacterium]
MNRFRLRGTWEDDPAPIPFPSGRDAGATETTGDHAFDHAATTDDVIRSVEAEFERASLKIDELRDLLSPFNGDTDPPPAA